MIESLRNIIIAHLRRIGYRNVNRKRVEAEARKARGQYECAKCLQTFKRDQIHLDHIDPVIVPERGFEDWNTYIDRLFLGNLQALCLTCHYEKSRIENLVRRGRRNG